MKTNKTITSALLALGLISAAGAAYADSTISIGGHTYDQVFLTGSTAARANVYNALFATSGGVFTGGPTGSEGAAGATISNGTSNYSIWGQIGAGNYYCVCVDLTGSEAGLYALQHETQPEIDVTVGSTTYDLPGTPNPSAFVNPNTGVVFTNTADLAMADTSQKVSLSYGGGFANLTDFGLVGAVPFEWVKGKNSGPDSSWTNLVNITDPQANIVLGSPDQYASYFTGVAANQDGVYVVGRNRGSGTRVNTMLDTLHGVTIGVDQWAPADTTYAGTPPALTFGTIQSITSAGGLIEVGNDGYDGGSSVAKVLEDDEKSAIDPNGNGTNDLILIGYLGTSDASTATGGGAVALTLNGVAENDGNVEQGTYSFWGHEHLYGTASVDSAVETVGQTLAGSSVNEKLGTGNTAGGALQSAGGLGGPTASAQDSIIAPSYMNADKPNDGDSGYASQL